jgi:translation initiation factor IF-2
VVVKVRIHELAKDLKMENKDLIKLLEKMGLPVKGVQSTLDESDVERVKNQISLSKKEGVVEQRVKPTVIRRRVMKEEPAPEPPPPPPKEEVKPAVEAKPPGAKKEEVKPPVEWRRRRSRSRRKRLRSRPKCRPPRQKRRRPLPNLRPSPFPR